MKILLYEISSRFEILEEIISEFEDGSIEILQSEEQREKQLKKKDQILRDLWNNIKHTNLNKRREKRGRKKV